MDRQDAERALAEPLVTRLSRARARGFAWLAEPRAVRERWFATLSRMLDGGLRSPLFLRCMRYGLAASFEMQSRHARALGRLPARRSEAQQR